jgi:hypothetical protein
MAEAGKDCGVDLIVNERTQTNVCKAQRVTVNREREVDDVGRREKKGKKPEDQEKAIT